MAPKARKTATVQPAHLGSLRMYMPTSETRAQATINSGAATLPLDVSGDGVGEQFKYVTLSRQSGTATTSLKVRMSILYVLDSDQT